MKDFFFVTPPIYYENMIDWAGCLSIQISIEVTIHALIGPRSWLSTNKLYLGFTNHIKSLLGVHFAAVQHSLPLGSCGCVITLGDWRPLQA